MTDPPGQGEVGDEAPSARPQDRRQEPYMGTVGDGDGAEQHGGYRANRPRAGCDNGESPTNTGDSSPPALRARTPECGDNEQQGGCDASTHEKRIVYDPATVGDAVAQKPLEANEQISPGDESCEAEEQPALSPAERNGEEGLPGRSGIRGTGDPSAALPPSAHPRIGIPCGTVVPLLGHSPLLPCNCARLIPLAL